MKIGEIKLENNSRIVCPKCGANNLHPESVLFFNEHSVTTIDSSETAVEQLRTEDVDTEEDCLCVQFVGECKHRVVMRIVYHEGCSYVFTEYPDVNVNEWRSLWPKKD